MQQLIKNRNGFQQFDLFIIFLINIPMEHLLYLERILKEHSAD